MANRRAAYFQCVHQAEHAILLMTVFAFGRPLSVTTLFGAADVRFRVTCHFLLNLAGSVAWAWAIVRHVPLRRRTLRPLGVIA
jgi:hypothetical protein